MDPAAIESRLARLESIEEIRRLKAQYCQACDDDHNPEKVAALFAENSVWESTVVGPARGRDAVCELFRSFVGVFTFAQHMATNPIITVDGDRAHAVWHVVVPCVMRGETEMRWLMARYDDDCVKVDGTWKFEHVRAFPRVEVELPPEVASSLGVPSAR